MLILHLCVFILCPICFLDVVVVIFFCGVFALKPNQQAVFPLDRCSFTTLERPTHHSQGVGQFLFAWTEILSLASSSRNWPQAFLLLMRRISPTRIVLAGLACKLYNLPCGPRRFAKRTKLLRSDVICSKIFYACISWRSEIIF